MRHRLGAVWTLVVILAWGGSLGATLALRLSIEEMAEKADVVVEGKVLSTRSLWGGKGRRIVTLAEVEVIRSYKGHLQGAVITVQRLGGVVDGLGMNVAGSARLETGERAFLFLTRLAEADGEQRYRALGMAQGKFRIEEREGRPVASRDVGSLSLAEREGEKGSLRVIRRPEDQELPLGDLERRVLQVVKRKITPREAP